MPSPHPETEREAEENGDSATQEAITVPLPTDDPLDVMRRGPREIFQFIEGSFSQLEAKLRHNNEVLQGQAQEIMKRVEGLEQSLQTILKEVSSYSQDPPLSDDVEARPSLAVDQ